MKPFPFIFLFVTATISSTVYGNWSLQALNSNSSLISYFNLTQGQVKGQVGMFGFRQTIFYFWLRDKQMKENEGIKVEIDLMLPYRTYQHLYIKNTKVKLIRAVTQQKFRTIDSKETMMNATLGDHMLVTLENQFIILTVQFNENLIHYEYNKENSVYIVFLVFFVAGISTAVVCIFFGGYQSRMVIGVEPYDFFLIQLTCLTPNVEGLPLNIIVAFCGIIFFIVKFLRSTTQGKMAHLILFFVGTLYYLQILSIDTIPIAVGVVHACETVNMVRRTKKTNAFLKDNVVVVILMNLSILFILASHQMLVENIYVESAISQLTYLGSLVIQLITTSIDYNGGPNRLKHKIVSEVQKRFKKNPIDLLEKVCYVCQLAYEPPAINQFQSNNWYLQDMIECSQLFHQTCLKNQVKNSGKVDFRDLCCK